MFPNREIVTFLFIAALALISISATAETPKELKNDRLFIQIEKRGDAKFFRRNGDIIAHAWTVNCGKPMVSCVARQGGLLLSLDESLRPRLIAMSPIGARIAIREKNLRQEVRDLFSAPLTLGQVERLSQRESRVTITLFEDVVLNANTEGLLEVVAFLTWMTMTGNRVSGDARQWRFDPFFQMTRSDPNALNQHRFRDESEREPPTFTVPYTKPQIQFAIRAQQ